MLNAAWRPRPQPLAKPSQTGSGRRLDIQGLRAIAVLSVVVYHAGARWLPGGYVGVDVFFVVSGYLISAGLVEEARETGRVSWTGFYARRIRRILPAATVTLVGVAILSLTVLPPLRRSSIANDIVASALDVMNFRLAGGASNYLAADKAPSPLQHFWSLAVEEQFYLVWPLVLVGITALVGTARFPRRRRLLEPILLLTVGLGVAASLAASILITKSDPQAAYFVTWTRAWELGIGAALAVLARSLSGLGQVAAAVLGWLGLAAIGYALLTFDAATPFPGWHALIPTVGTALLLLAGLTPDSPGPGRILGLQPLTLIGDISYSYYLWHWPLIVAAQARVAHFTVTIGLIVGAAALIPAWLSWRFVETPALQGRRLDLQANVLAAGPVLMCAGVFVGVFVFFTHWPPAPPPSRAPLVSQQTPAGSSVTTYGAQILAADPRNDPNGAPVNTVDGPLYPSIDEAGTNIAGCPTLVADQVLKPCTYGVQTTSTGAQPISIALVGDSHAAQWATALNAAAHDAGWSVTEYTKQACPLSDIETSANGRTGDANCLSWNSQAQKQLLTDPRDIVLISSIDRSVFRDGRILSDSASAQALANSEARVWAKLEAAGSQVILLRDTPLPGVDIPDCLSAHPDHMTSCTFARSAGNDNGKAGLAAAAATGVKVIDLNDAICPTETCAPVIGHEIVYADTNHMTATYGLSLTPRLEQAIKSAIGAS